MSARVFSFVLGVAALACSTNASAQATYRMAPVGGRTTLVGGTGLVWGHDSASAFLNPATTLNVDSSRLAFSVNFYNLSVVSSGSWYQPGNIDRDRFGSVRRESNTALSTIDLDALPGSLCVFIEIRDVPFLAWRTKQKLGEKRARLGLCLASISYDQFTFNAEDYTQPTPQGVSRQAQNVRQSFRRVAVGPSYSMYVTDRLAFGASLHFSRTSHRSLFGATATTYGAPKGPITSSFYHFAHGDSQELTWTLGTFYRISPRQTVALTFEAPSIHLWGDGGLNFHSTYAGADSETSTVTANGDFRTKTPLRVALGTGIQERWGTAEVDVSYRPATSSVYTAGFSGAAVSVAKDGSVTEVARRQTFGADALGSVSLGIGGEGFVSPRLSLLGGFSADASIVPKGALLTDPLAYHQSRMHRVALSFGVGTHTEGGDLLFGLETSYGWGQRLAPNVYELPTSLAVTDFHNFGFLFVLAGSTSFGNIKRAVNEVTRVLGPGNEEKPGEEPKK